MDKETVVTSTKTRKNNRARDIFIASQDREGVATQTSCVKYSGACTMDTYTSLISDLVVYQRFIDRMMRTHALLSFEYHSSVMGSWRVMTVYLAWLNALNQPGVRANEIVPAGIPNFRCALCSTPILILCETNIGAREPLFDDPLMCK
jgi:hypothetical protein